MRVQFWGVRGSLPTPLTSKQFHDKLAPILVAAREANLASPDAVREFLRDLPEECRRVVGGNTSCVEIITDSQARLICDAGTGIRELGYAWVQRAQTETPSQAEPETQAEAELQKTAATAAVGQREMHVLISHTHWDHISGLPFCEPLYRPEWAVHFYGGHSDLHDRLRRQHDPAHFPVAFESFQPPIETHILAPGVPTDVATMRVTAGRLDHPGDSFAYRIEADGATLIYAADGGFVRHTDAMRELLDSGFFAGADMLIYDAQFTAEEAAERIGWGHSSPTAGVELCLEHRIPALVLFHHDPKKDDTQLFAMLRGAHQLVADRHASERLTVYLACEGWGINVPTPKSIQPQLGQPLS